LYAVPDRAVRAAAWAAVAMEIYVCAAVGDWWGSASCGARRFVVVGPLIGLGIAALAAAVTDAAASTTSPPRRRRYAPAWLASAVLACILWNVRLTQYYVRGYLPKNPANPVDYMRDLPPNAPRLRIWRLWEYGRWLSEVQDAERRMWR